jgi:hypothetical protein
MANLIDDEVVLVDGAPNPTQKLKSYAGAKAAISDLLTFLSTYSLLQWLDAIRKTLNPYESVTFLDPATPFTTPTILAADGYTKVLIPTTVKFLNGWAFNDIGGGEIALQKIAAGTQKYDIRSYTGIRAGGSNITMHLALFKNGTLEGGISIPRRIGAGADTGALAMGGVFSIDQNQYVNVYVKVSSDTTITFDSPSIDIRERN